MKCCANCTRYSLLDSHYGLCLCRDSRYYMKRTKAWYSRQCWTNAPRNMAFLDKFRDRDPFKTKLLKEPVIQQVLRRWEEDSRLACERRDAALAENEALRRQVVALKHEVARLRVALQDAKEE